MCPLQTGATGQPSLLTLVTITAGDDCEHPSLSLVHGHWPTPADSSRLAQVPLACGYAEHSSAPPRVDMQSPAGHSGLTAGLHPLSTECRPSGLVGLHTCGAGVLLLVAVDHALNALERIVGGDDHGSLIPDVLCYTAGSASLSASQGSSLLEGGSMLQDEGGVPPCLQTGECCGTLHPAPTALTMVFCMSARYEAVG